MIKIILLFMVIYLVSGCSDNGPSFLPAQFWGETEVVVETRPAPVVVGSNEFLVIASEPNNQPSDNIVVSLRMKKGDSWKQAIQDGGTGVYRKAMVVRASSKNVFVRLRRDGEVTVLSFPLFAESTL